jgi:hypothetical protein
MACAGPRQRERSDAAADHDEVIRVAGQGAEPRVEGRSARSAERCERPGQSHAWEQWAFAEKVMNRRMRGVL